jgi:hypothetical protein
MKKLHVLWTTGEKDVAIRMIFIYLMDAKSMGWWDEIKVRYMGEALTQYLQSGDKLVTF